MRVPHRDDPREPWTDDEIPKLYAATPAEPAWPEVDLPEPELVDVVCLLGPDGLPLPPSAPLLFGFQPHQETT